MDNWLILARLCSTTVCQAGHIVVQSINTTDLIEKVNFSILGIQSKGIWPVCTLTEQSCEISWDLASNLSLSDSLAVSLTFLCDLQAFLAEIDVRVGLIPDFGSPQIAEKEIWHRFVCLTCFWPWFQVGYTRKPKYFI